MSEDDWGRKVERKKKSKKLDGDPSDVLPVRGYNEMDREELDDEYDDGGF